MTTTATDPTAAAEPEPTPQPQPSGRRAARGKGAKSAKRGGRGAKVTRPGAATVNLLSPWVFEELRVHQLRRRFLFGLVVLLTVVALAWVALRFNLYRANEDLRGEEAVATGLTNQLRELAPVRGYVDGVERRIVTVTGATYDDVAFSRVLTSLAVATPPTASLASISVELAAAEVGSSEPGSRRPAADDPARGLVGSTCPGPDPFETKVVVGCVTFSGAAASRDAVSGFVVALGADKLFVEPFVDTTTTGEGDTVTFSGSVGLSPLAFSGRYDALDRELTKGATK